MYKFKVGDQVQVRSGRDKGKSGKIEKILLKENKAVIGGINIYKRHKKISKNKPAGIFEVERPLPIPNAAIICPKCSKPTRIGFVIEGNVKNRICKKCQGRLP